MAAVCALGSCSRMMPLRAILQPLGEQFQLLLPASSAPSRWPRGRRRTRRCRAVCRRPASRASFQKRESERTACSGSSWPSREAPFRPPRCPCRSRRSAAVRLHVFEIVMGPGVMRRRCDPAAAILRTSSGCSEAGLPIRKKVARTHSCASAASIFGVVAGHGPSSKVSTTSWSSSGSVCGKLFRPTRGVVAASTARMREVPSASLRGHSAASAAAIEGRSMPRPPSTAPR